MPLTVKVAVPALVIVSVAVAVIPVVTLPKARLPLTPMTKVLIVKVKVCAAVELL